MGLLLVQVGLLIIQDSNLVNNEEKEKLIKDEMIASSRLKCFPNPIQNKAQIEFFLSEASLVQINLLDFNQRKIQNLLNDNYLLEGIHSLELNVSNFNNGI